MRVRRISRVLFILLAFIIALIVVILIGANLYVQSSGAQEKIQQELSRKLGTSLKIRQISVTPWGGLKLSGITIPQDSPVQSGNFLEAKTFQLRLRLSALLAKRLVIRDVSLIDPEIVWPPDANGKWRLPASHAEQASVTANQAPAPSTPPAEAAPASPVAAVSPTPGLTSKPATEQPPEVSKRDFQPEVRHINVTDGSFRFLNRAGGTAANFEGVNFRSVLDKGIALHGQAKVAKVSLRDRFFLSNLQTPVRYTPTELALPKISAQAANGELSGEFAMHPQEEESPFSVSVRFRNVQADQIVTEAGGPSGTVQGNLEGKFDAQGKSANAEALTGTGEITMRDGQLRQYSLLVALGQVLQIEELTQLHLEQAEAKYHVDPGIVTVDEMILRSPNIRLSAKGTVGFDGKLQLASQLAINDKIRSQLFKPIRQNFQPTDDPAYTAVNFQITGTLERPKTDLVEKIVGRDLKDLGSVINSFLGGGSKSEKRKKKKGADATPNESPAESPAATEIATPSPTP